MRIHIKSLIKYIFPRFFHDLYNYLRQVPKVIKYRHLLKVNNDWNGYYSGEDVFIIGNGPSLADIDFAFIKGKKVIVMNCFEKFTWKNELEIVAHCIGEPYDSISWSEDVFCNSIMGTNSRSYWFHFTSYKKIPINTDDKKLYYVFPILEPGLWGRKSVSLNKPTLGYQTTAQLAIQVAIFMGFKKIFLIGFDHDWLASPKFSRHFYSNEKDDIDKLGRWRYLDIINFMQRMWRIYYTLKNSAERSGTQVINKTRGGFLDVFDTE